MLTCAGLLSLGGLENRRMVDRELALRVSSAALLGSVALALTYAGGWPFTSFIILVSVAVCWEWGRLVRGAQFDGWLVLHVFSIMSAAFALVLNQAMIAWLILGVVGALILVGRGLSGDRLSGLGVFYVGLPVLSLIWLRSDEVVGFLAVLFVFVIVWTSDSAAYVFGRAIGGPRLYPRVSPNKTWAGFLGGILASMIAGVAFGLFLGGTSPLCLGVIAVSLSLAAQFGDLTESALKRNFGFKDSSNLIPGHGGLLDRVDGLVLAAIVAAVIGGVVDPSRPGHGLLIWT